MLKYVKKNFKQSSFKKNFKQSSFKKDFTPDGGLEPPTTRLKVVRSTTELDGLVILFGRYCHFKGGRENDSE
jgi:hypothetical protein